MTFGIVPATKWQLKSDIGQDRRKRLLEASFDRIAHQITNHAEMDDYGSEPTKKTVFSVVAPFLYSKPSTAEMNPS